MRCRAAGKVGREEIEGQERVGGERIVSEWAVEEFVSAAGGNYNTTNDHDHEKAATFLPVGFRYSSTPLDPPDTYCHGRPQHLDALVLLDLCYELHVHPRQTSPHTYVRKLSGKHVGVFARNTSQMRSMTRRQYLKEGVVAAAAAAAAVVVEAAVVEAAAAATQEADTHSRSRFRGILRHCFHHCLLACTCAGMERLTRCC